MLLWSAVPAPAPAVSPATPAVRTAVFTIGSTICTVDGQAYRMDAAPVLADGHALVPLRNLAAALGVPPPSIGYQPLNRLKPGLAAVNIVRRRESGRPVEVTIFYSAVDPSLDVFAPHGLEGGFTEQFNTAPELVPPGRLLVPCLDIAQALGALVLWNAASRQVTLKTWKTLPAAGPDLSAEQVAMHAGSNTITAIYGGKPVGNLSYPYPVDIPNPYYPGEGQNPDLYALIPTLEAFGVPAQNILWDPDSRTLAVAADSPCRFIYLTVGANLNDNLTDELALDLDPPATGPSVSLVHDARLYIDNTIIMILAYGFNLRLTDPQGNSIDPILGNGDFWKA